MCSAVALDQLQLQISDETHLILMTCLKLEIAIRK